MAEYTAFRIDIPALEKLRVIADVKERSMAGQARFLINREYEDLKNQGLIVDKQVEEE